MNDSLASADDNQQPISLYQEINKINTDEWHHEEFLPSPRSLHSSFDQQDRSFDRQDHSFSNHLPLESRICDDLLELQDVLETTHREAEQEKASCVRSDQKSEQAALSVSSQGNVASQVTITLMEESLGSKAFQETDTQDDSNFSTSLRSFLSLNEKNYRPHVICLKFLFSKLKDYSRHSLESLKLYTSFLEIKLKQEAQALKPLDHFAAGHDGQEEEDEVNIDEKVLMERMRAEMEGRRAKRKAFFTQIQQIHEELLSTWRKIKEKREKRERVMEEEIVRVIDRIELQMEDMIKCRLLNEREKAEGKFVSERVRSQNPYLSRDKYLEMKYLIQRENAYLKLIAHFNGKLTTYMINMFSKEEVQVARLIREAFADYSAAFMNCYGHSQLLALKVEKAEEGEADVRLRRQLAALLLGFIPKELYDMGQNEYKFEQSGDRLQAILGDFSNSLQNTIFMSTIQMNNEFILFRNEAVWKTSKSFFEREEHCIDYESRQALANSKSTHNAHSSNAHSADLHPAKDARIVVVLTSNYFLHLEDDDKVATVCLGEVKLSKRGREVIICDKGKGIGGYFGMKTELGRLEFETTEEVDIFAQKLALALRRLASP